MRKSGFLRAPSLAWALEAGDVPAEAGVLAEQAVKLLETRRLIWKVNLTLVGILVVSHVALKFLVPGFAAAEYLATEIGVLEAVTVVVTRRIAKKERRLKEEFLEVSKPDS